MVMTTTTAECKKRCGFYIKAAGMLMEERERLIGTDSLCRCAQMDFQEHHG